MWQFQAHAAQAVGDAAILSKDKSLCTCAQAVAASSYLPTSSVPTVAPASPNSTPSQGTSLVMPSLPSPSGQHSPFCSYPLAREWRRTVCTARLRIAAATLHVAMRIHPSSVKVSHNSKRTKGTVRAIGNHTFSGFNWRSRDQTHSRAGSPVASAAPSQASPPSTQTPAAPPQPTLSAVLAATPQPTPPAAPQATPAAAANVPAPIPGSTPESSLQPSSPSAAAAAATAATPG